MAGVKGRSGTNKGKEKAFADAVRVAVNRDGDGGRKKLTLLADKLVECALAGEGWAMQQVADRLDGKPAQAIEHSGNIDLRRASEVSDDELAAIASGSGEGVTESPVDPSQLN
jgi:hypothetical protein